MYKIETHLHTNIVSPCGTLEPEEEIRGYKNAGYAGIVVTDHMNRDTVSRKGFDIISDGDKLSQFLKGYEVMKRLGEEVGLKVYRGMELRFDGSANDYLVYGYSDELLSNPHRIMGMSPMEFHELAKEDGALFIQAHPFRDGCIPIAPEYLDGVEGCNRHVVHNNRNNLAWAFGQRHGLLMTGGSDCHDPADIGMGGIDANWLPEDSMELAKLLRSGEFTVLGKDF